MKKLLIMLLICIVCVSCNAPDVVEGRLSKVDTSYDATRSFEQHYFVSLILEEGTNQVEEKFEIRKDALDQIYPLTGFMREENKQYRLEMNRIIDTKVYSLKTIYELDTNGNIKHSP